MKENFPTNTILAANRLDGVRYISSQMIPYVKKYKDTKKKWFQSKTKEIDERWYEYNAKKKIERNILDDYNGTDIPATEVKINGVIYYYMVINDIAYMFSENYKLIYYFQLIKIDNSDVKDCPLVIKKRNKNTIKSVDMPLDIPTILDELTLNTIRNSDDCKGDTDEFNVGKLPDNLNVICGWK